MIASQDGAEAPDATLWQPSSAAVAHVQAAVASWTGDSRDLALALQLMGHALLLIAGGKVATIAMYEAAAQVIATGAEMKGSA